MARMELGRVSKLIEQHDTLVLGTNQTFGLQDFAHDVKQAIPGCRVTPENEQWSWVYMPDDHYAMGMIGYGDFRDKGDGTFMYTVKSRTISNGKYGEYSRQYHMKMSTSRDTAVKNARANLRRYTPVELIGATKQAAQLEISQARQAASNEHSKLTVAAFGATFYRSEPAYVAELKHLLDSGHEFMDRTLADNLTAYFKSKAEQDEVRGTARNMTFVCMSTYFGAPRCDLIDVDNVGAFNSQISEPRTYSGADITEHVSEDVMGKVAMLNMLEEDTYVQGVGFKLFDGIYYVDR